MFWCYIDGILKKKKKNKHFIYKYFKHVGGEEVYFRSNIKWKLGDYMQLYILHYFLYYYFIKSSHFFLFKKYTVIKVST